MPMPHDADGVLYNDKDGRELDDRADSFARSCVRTLRDVGYYDSFVGKSVLDVGCGRGVLLSMLPASVRIGVDPQTGAVHNAVPCVRVVLGTIEKIRLEFDIVMSWHVVEHVDDPPAFVCDMVAHTKPGMLVMIATPNADSIMARSESWRCREPFHKYLLGRRLLRNLMTDCGLVIERKATWGGFPAPRKAWQEAANQVLKACGHGDVQLIIARKL
jgi:2-polyprenyl-3-methyl-5-hydroxy-6-metoxy-1,4-benzoquinol methylase